LGCSFCHRAQAAVNKLIGSPGKHPSASCICDECVAVCKTKVMERYDEKARSPQAEAGVSKQRWDPFAWFQKAARCSFCGTTGEFPRKLIASPDGRTRICDGCVAICLNILTEPATPPLAGTLVDSLGRKREGAPPYIGRRGL
jgi:ATP-dependent protease Clp ATPase subunit